MEALRRDSTRLLQEISDLYDSLRSASRLAEKEKKALSEGLSSSERDNEQLAGQVASLQSQAAENGKLQAQLSSKSAAMDELSLKLKQTTQLLKKERTRSAGLEVQNISLTTELETKSKVIESYDYQIRTIRDANHKRLKQEPFRKSLEVEVSRLTSENRDLHDQMTKTVEVADLNNQIRYLRRSNEKLTRQMQNLTNKSG
jgi:chromosome segregation ATPase